MCISESELPRRKGVKVCRGVGLCRLFRITLTKTQTRRLYRKRVHNPTLSSNPTRKA